MKDPQFQSLQSDPVRYRDHYESGFNQLSIKVLLLHTLSYLFKVKQHIRQNAEIDGHPPLKEHQLKNIQYQDSSIYIAQSMHRQIVQKYQQDGQKLTGKDVLKMMVSHLRGIIIYSIVLYFLELAFKLWFSGNLMSLFLAISEGDKREAYIHAAVACVIWFCGQVFRHNAYYSIPIISCRVRAGVVMLLFAKVSRLTSYAARASQLGKITNLLSSDFNAIETKLPFVLAGLMLPFGLVGGTVLIWIMVGWPAIFTFIVPLIIFPIVLNISRKIKQFIVLISVSKDKRIKLCSQLIEGIKYIKLYGWEMAFKKKIQLLREDQISNFMSLALGRTFEKAVSNSVAYFTGFFIFFAASYVGSLGINDIFSSLQVLTYLRFQLFYFISGISLYYELEVTFQRIANVLNQPEVHMLQANNGHQTNEPLELIIKSADNKQTEEIQPTAEALVIKSHQETKTQKWKQTNLVDPRCRIGEIVLQDFCGWWTMDPNGQPHLKNISFHCRPLQFYGIIGEIGSGKSGLLSALTGQIPYYKGTLKLNGKIAFVQQQPVILSGTVRQNILFQSDYDEILYNRVIQYANLGPDFDQFPDSDNTLVGEKGITLSGGQKARIALGRALYTQADIYLLDDPLSAVDVKVAKQLVQNCILPLTKSATVILATHQIQFLYSCDRILVMEKGRIVQNGFPYDILPIVQDIRASGKPAEEEAESVTASITIHQKTQREVVPTRRVQSSVQVNLQSYQFYLFITEINKFLFPLTILLFIVSQGVNMFYLRVLAQYNNMADGNYFITNLSSYWLLLGMLQLTYFILQVLRYLSLNIALLLSNQELHQRMIHGIVRSPSRFFDLTPSGQLINAFSNDLGLLDMTLPFSFTDMIEGPIISVVMLINVFTIQLPFIPLGIFNIIFLVFFFIYAKNPIVECRQLYLKQRTPVFGIFGEMIISLSQIRVFGKRMQKLKAFAQTADLSSKTNMSFQVISRGFGVYVSYVSSLIMFVAFFIGVHLTAPSDAGNYGVIIILLTSVSDYLQYFLKQIITVQSIMLSSERAKKIVNLPSEAPFRTEYDETIGLKEEIIGQSQGKQVMVDWPRIASVILSNFSLRYREELPLVLKNIDLKIKSGERVGIVGRTGAGKSSIIQAIFRLTEPEPDSQYFIGQSDALKMGLHSLRKHISVIPQTPFLFKGTVRENLDPFRKKDDADIWNALQEAGLSNFIKSLPDNLQTDISTVDIFSVGQKQLICLARALLRKNHLLVLDEATSNVDTATDERIQHVIREKFVGTTVLTVAHRLTTIADYDKIVVMAEGRIVQAGAPWQLIQRGGHFSQMVGRSGNIALQIRLKAKNRFNHQQ